MQGWQAEALRITLTLIVIPAKAGRWIQLLYVYEVKKAGPLPSHYPIHTIPLAICAPYLMAWYFWSPLAKVAGPGLL